jgi:1-acyl-sn-glycerol-3-phosphate acyltransferase
LKPSTNLNKNTKSATLTPSTKKKLIDIEQVIGDKNPKLLRILPGFIIRYIKKILHQDDINDFINRHGHKYDFDFIAAIIDEFGAKIELKGEENIIREGPCIYAANHPLGGLDGMAVMHIIGQYRKDLNFIVNDVLLSLENLKNVFIPVNKHGKNSTAVVSQITELYQSDKGILIFPAGLVSRKNDKGEIRDLEWKKSFITKARQYKKTIVPVFIEGQNSAWFYNLARFRKKLGIKANIEMFYLVDEMYRQKNKTITIVFGKPITYNEISQLNLSDAKLTGWFKDKVYQLAESKSPKL